MFTSQFFHPLSTTSTVWANRLHLADFSVDVGDIARQGQDAALSRACAACLLRAAARVFQHSEGILRYGVGALIVIIMDDNQVDASMLSQILRAYKEMFALQLAGLAQQLDMHVMTKRADCSNFNIVQLWAGAAYSSAQALWRRGWPGAQPLSSHNFTCDLLQVSSSDVELPMQCAARPQLEYIGGLTSQEQQ